MSGGDDMEAYFDLADEMLALAKTIDEMLLVEPDDGQDPIVMLLKDTQHWLRGRATVFRPPGIAKEGYPAGHNLADVVNLESWRALHPKRRQPA